MSIRIDNGSKGVTDHSALSNLTSATAGHTGYEATITSGTSVAQYYRGDKVFADLNTNYVPYTGATSAVNIGSQDFDTTGTVHGGNLEGTGAVYISTIDGYPSGTNTYFPEAIINSGGIIATSETSHFQAIGAGASIFSTLTGTSASKFINILAGASVFSSVTASGGSSYFQAIGAGASIFTSITASAGTSKFSAITAAGSIFTSMSATAVTATTLASTGSANFQSLGAGPAIFTSATFGSLVSTGTGSFQAIGAGASIFTSLAVGGSASKFINIIGGASIFSSLTAQGGSSYFQTINAGATVLSSLTATSAINVSNLLAGASIVTNLTATGYLAGAITASYLNILSSIPTTAGIFPTYTLGSGATSTAVYLRGDGSWQTPAGGPANVTSGDILAYSPLTVVNSSGAVLNTDVYVTITTANLIPTANQVLVTGGSGAVMAATTLSLPQDIGTASNVQFGGVYGTSTGQFANVLAGASILSSISTTSASTFPNLVSGASIFSSLTAQGGSSYFQTINAGASVVSSLSVGSAFSAPNILSGASTFTSITVGGGTSYFQAVQAGCAILSCANVSVGSGNFQALGAGPSIFTSITATIATSSFNTINAYSAIFSGSIGVGSGALGLTTAGTSIYTFCKNLSGTAYDNASLYVKSFYRNAALILCAGTTGVSSIYFNEGTDSVAGTQRQSVIGDHATGNLDLYTSGIKRATITSSGSFVGINSGHFNAIGAGASIVTSLQCTGVGTSTFSAIAAGASIFTSITATVSSSNFQAIGAGASIFTSASFGTNTQLAAPYSAFIGGSLRMGGTFVGVWSNNVASTGTAFIFAASAASARSAGYLTFVFKSGTSAFVPFFLSTKS